MGHKVNLYKRHFSLRAEAPVFHRNTIPMPPKRKIICDNAASQHDSQEKNAKRPRAEQLFDSELEDQFGEPL